MVQRSVTLVAVLGGVLMLQGCLVGAAVGAGAAVVGAAGSVVGAGVDAVTTSDQETKLKREREQRRCEQRQRQGKGC